MYKKGVTKRVLSFILAGALLTATVTENTLYTSAAEDGATLLSANEGMVDVADWESVSGDDVSSGDVSGSNGVQGDVSDGNMEPEENIQIASGENIASGISRGCAWTLDAEGKLIVRDSDGTYGTDNWGWKDYEDKIKTADVNISYADLEGMFAECTSLTNAKVKINDAVGKVAHEMFYYCESLTDIDVKGLITTNVTDMSDMFGMCFNLTSIDASGFDTSKVTNMDGMFWGCINLTNIDVSRFDTRQVTNMSGIFFDCYNLMGIDVSGFDTSKVTDMRNMFGGCNNVTGIDVSGFDTSQVTNMSGMFGGCNNVTSIDVSGFDTSQVTSMSDMFRACSKLTSIDISGFDTSQVTDMSDMFYDCSKLTSIDVRGFDTSQVTSMSHMFLACSKLTSIDISGFDTSQVTDMRWMFSSCSNLMSIDISGFDTSQVTSMRGMFSGCSNLTSIDVRSFDTSQVTDMSDMFSGCSKLTSIDVSGFDTSQVTNMRVMFGSCRNLTSIDVSGFAIRNVKDMDDMFFNCISLRSIKVFTHFNQEMDLPISSMYDQKGSKYTKFPKGLSEGIWLYADTSYIPAYTITYVLEEGINDSRNPDSYAYGSKAIRLYNPTRPGYSFAGWYTTPKFTGKLTQIPKNANKDYTLYAKWTPIANKITYVLNLSGASNPNASKKTYKITDEEYVLKDAVKKGFTFLGWYRDAACTQPVETIKTGTYGNLMLYAKWRGPQYTVSYDGNGAESGEEADTHHEYIIGKTPLSSGNGFYKKGYHVDAWYRNARCSGKKYIAGYQKNDLSSSDGDNVTLYAHWVKNTYYVSYNGNGATGGNTSPSKFTYDQAAKLKNNGFRRTGYIFTGWNTKADGSGTMYSQVKLSLLRVKNLTEENNATVTLYAQWMPISYQVIFNGNKATGGSMETYTAKYDEAFSLPANTYTRTGYRFKGWRTTQKINGQYLLFTDGQQISRNLCSSNNARITLNAVWEYDVIMNPNGGTGTPVTLTYESGKYQNLPANTFTRQGYIFVGWTFVEGDNSFLSKIAFKDKAKPSKDIVNTNGQTIVLYAKWKPITSYTIKFVGFEYNAKTNTYKTIKAANDIKVKPDGSFVIPKSTYGWNNSPNIFKCWSLSSGNDYTDKVLDGTVSMADLLSDAQGDVVTVYAICDSVSIKLNGIGLRAEETYDLNACLSMPASRYSKFKWTSSNNGIARVDSKGILTATKKGGKVVLTLKAGNYVVGTITAEISTFKPRKVRPVLNVDEYYFTNKNIYYQSYMGPNITLWPTNYNEGNCTWYAFGRASEISGHKITYIGSWDAGSWWTKCNEESRKGSIPKVGAIICWSHHVAIVEELYSDGTMLISESSAGTPNIYFQTRRVSQNNPGNGSDTFQGFIYTD